MPTTLQLAPSQGGILFGPFEGVVQIGSDARRAQIQLDARHGIYPIHATLALTSTGTHQFAPAERDAKCFVVQQGSEQVWPVQGAVQVSSGDSLILGTPGGPRFLLRDVSAAEAKQAMGSAGSGLMGAFDNLVGGQRRRPQSFADGMAYEVQRRAQSQLYRYGAFRELAYFYRRYKTGQLFTPYTIVGMLVGAAGMISAAVFGCMGTVAALISRFL